MNTEELIMLLSEIHSVTDDTADLFYQMKLNEGISKATQLISDLNMVYKIISTDARIEGLVRDDFVEALQESVKSLKECDYIMFADYLHYEIARQIGELRVV